jgi:hypothetical protein
MTSPNGSSELGRIVSFPVDLFRAFLSPEQSNAGLDDERSALGRHLLHFPVGSAPL